MEYRELPHGGEKFDVIGLGTAQLGATQSPFGQALIRYQCLQYALDTPGVVCVVPGVRDRADLRVLLGFFDAPGAEKDCLVLNGLAPEKVAGRGVYYTPWLLRRFEEGYVLARNPLFPNKVTRYELDPAVVDCVVFCSKDYAPILPHLHKITDRFNTYFYYTITAYGRDIEPGVPSIERSMETLIALAEQVGPQRVAWRYDPVLLTPTYTLERHRETFSRMCNVLTPHMDRCIFSFVEMYKKLRLNMSELMPLSVEDMDALARMLGSIAACALAVTASRRATSAPTTPAPTAAATATPTRTTVARPRTTACTIRKAHCS